MDTKKVKQIEKVLGTQVDGIWGDDDKMALKTVVGTPKGTKAPPSQPQPRAGMTPMTEAPAESATYQ